MLGTRITIIVRSYVLVLNTYYVAEPHVKCISKTTSAVLRLILCLLVYMCSSLWLLDIWYSFPCTSSFHLIQLLPSVSAPSCPLGSVSSVRHQWWARSNICCGSFWRKICLRVFWCICLPKDTLSAITCCFDLYFRSSERQCSQLLYNWEQKYWVKT